MYVCYSPNGSNFMKRLINHCNWGEKKKVIRRTIEFMLININVAPSCRPCFSTD